MITKAVNRFGRMVPADFVTAVMVIVAIVVGVFLRLHLILDQVLLDDEWHSLHYVIDKSFGYLLTHFSIPGATSIPLNVYTLTLLKTTGWNELLLRLPAIVTGIMSLVCFPILVRPLVDRRGLPFFTMLLAISPFLIFYSRVARPYSLFLLFGFTSLMFGYTWLVAGSGGYRVAYLLTGILAVESHLFALSTVVAPLVIGSLFKLGQLRRPLHPAREIVPSWKDLAACGAVLAAVVVGLQGPALLATARTVASAVIGRDTLTGDAAWHAVCLVSGTANPALVLVFTGLALLGLLLLIRENPLAASLFVALVVGNVVVMSMARPESIHAAMVIARYCIIAYPIGFILVTKGFHACLSRLHTLTGLGQSPWGAVLHGLVPVGFATVLFLFGPLPQQHEEPNNFTNHSAYQHAYEPIDWGRTYVSEMKPRDLKTGTTIRLQELSPFYHRLRMDQSARRIVEFPMMIGDHFNPYYYYQHFHRKQVAIGYDRNCPELLKLMPGGVYGNSYVDEVLSRVADRRQIRFRTLVDMADIDALRRSGADYVVLHTRFEAELSRIALPNPNIGSLCKLYAQYFGPPYYEDNHLVVFQLKGAMTADPNPCRIES